MVVFVAFIMAVVGWQVAAAFPDNPQQTVDVAQAYGNQTYGEGNYTVYNANVIGSHGGLHLALDNGTVVHLHDVPNETLYNAYLKEANESVADPWATAEMNVTGGVTLAG